jgi:alkanesulfonate monooxygenase SsuD/methylene tetrahydromethanopterin reductase-like flavin-dependent oxidoreductase (luciferase family)
MELGVYSFAEAVADPNTGRRISPQERLKDLVEEIELADQVGLDVYGLGEHHRELLFLRQPLQEPRRFVSRVR